MKPTKDLPVRWFHCRDDRHHLWRVLLTRPDITPLIGVNEDGFEDHGTTSFDRREVYVNANRPKRFWTATALHELNHVALVDTAFEDEDAEAFVEVHAVRFLPILGSMGFRFPDPPKLPWARKR